MKASLFAVLFLALPRLALAQGVCDQNGPAAQFLNANAQAQRRKHHDWMTKVRATTPDGWDNATIGEILIPGSHDSGTYGATYSKPKGSSDRWGQTQTYSFLDQLCQGSRWFDVRFKKAGNEFHVWHNTHLFGTSGAALGQFRRFIADPGHSGEVIFIRFKTQGGETAVERRGLFQTWANTLRRWLVPYPGNIRYGQLRLGALANLPAQHQPGARVFLLDYEPPIDAHDALRPSFWSYSANQSGTFSNKVALSKIRKGQTKSLRAWKANKANKTFGLWWTSTGTVGALDVKKNTKELWPKRKNTKAAPLEKFFKENNCEVGNFLIVDFFGDLPLLRTRDNLVVQLASQYNVAKLHDQRHPLCQARR